MSDYQAFLAAKAVQAPDFGFEVDPAEINPALKDFVKDIVLWGAAGGRRAIFTSFGLHKTSTQLELARLAHQRAGAVPIIVLPLGVRHEFMEEGATRFRGDHAVTLRFIRRTEDACERSINLTNYESVREGKVDPRAFGFASLDEAACLRAFGGTKTFREFMRLFPSVPYRYVATATPDPNEYIELLAYAAFLGVMDVGEAKTRFFKRDSERADKLTLHPHKTEEFWLWVASWALFVRRPSDLGYSDDGYVLPALDVRWHEVVTDHASAGADRDGQIRMFRNAAFGVVEASREKRGSLPARIAKLAEIRAEDPTAHRIIWHDLEDERRAIERLIPDARSIYGSQDLETNERNAIDFKHGRYQELATKPQMSGAGSNFQHHCHWAAFLGIGHKFHDFIQACHRLARFGQRETVRIDLIYTEAEREIRRSLEAKWRRHEEQAEAMSRIIAEYGLSRSALAHAMRRSMGVERAEVSGEGWRLVNNDCVDETRAMAADSVDLIVTSIPFCFDEQTEILTRRGWLGFGDLTPGDDVATVHPQRHFLEWQRPSHLVWERYDGEMLRFGNRSFDLLVTPNHRLWAARRGSGFGPDKLRLVEAREIAKDYEGAKRKGDRQGRLLRGWKTCLVPPAAGGGDRPERIDIPPLPEDIRSGHGVELYWIDAPEFMALAGWYLSEGHADSFDNGRLAGRLSIAQVKDEQRREEIAVLFRRIGLPPSMHSRQITVWCRNLAYFIVQEFGTGSKNKRIPAWVRELHPDLLRILRDTMMKGDGAKDGSVYVSYSPTLRDHFQEICLKTGWRATITGNRVNVGSDQIFPEIRRGPDRVAYSGMIGCATVPNGTLIVRRNGKPCISGNSTQYEYTPSFNDFGHTDDDAHFWRQMDFLTPELLRVLRPGRVCAVHVKDRIVPGGINGLGFQTVSPFSDDCVAQFRRHGFAFLARKTVVTDVVRENNQTYRLGWTEQCKDGSRMGAGMPEYVLLFRKPPSDLSNGYADDPIVKAKPLCDDHGDPAPFDARRNWKRPVPGTGYSRARWQLDAHGFTRSSGDRLLSSEELRNLPHEQLYKLWRDRSSDQVYDFAGHLAVTEELDHAERLPATFMLLPPHSWHPDVWSDVTRMRTLNGQQHAKGRELHLCPLQFDVVDRLIVQFSMEGEEVYDPFSGLGTVVLRALQLKRKGRGVELGPGYHADAVAHLQAAEREASIPTLFDLIDAEAAA